MAILSLTPRALISKAGQGIVMTQNSTTRNSVIFSQHLFRKWEQGERETKTGNSLCTVECLGGPVCSPKGNVLTVFLYFITK